MLLALLSSVASLKMLLLLPALLIGLASCHPCDRTCKVGDTQECHYKFKLEWYATNTKACFECASGNSTDCEREDCVVGNGEQRSILTVNRMMPGPSIRVCVNDTIIVEVENHLAGGEGTTIHWHGIHQEGTPYMDGVPMITQCPIATWSSFEYRFQAWPTGTHFWHSHNGMQRGDGLYGGLMVDDPADPHTHLYDFDLDEHMIFVQDWLPEAISTRYALHHNSGWSNKPDTLLISGKGAPKSNRTSDNLKKVFRVERSKTYRFRVISNAVLNCPIQLSVVNHTLVVISTDGRPIDPVTVDSFIIGAGERLDFLLTADQPVTSYWIRAGGLADCERNQAQQEAILLYDGTPSQELSPGAPPTYTETVFPTEQAGRPPQRIFNPFSEGVITSSQYAVTFLNANSSDYEKDPDWLGQAPDKKFYLSMDFYYVDNPLFNKNAHYPHDAFDDGDSRRQPMPQINHVSNKMMSSPILSNGNLFKDPDVCEYMEKQNCVSRFCTCTHVLRVSLGDVVEVILIDEGQPFNASNHPMHIHGGTFRIVAMGQTASLNTTLVDVKALDEAGEIPRKLEKSVVKDTVRMPVGGYVVTKFKATNPGAWFFHCHNEFHAEIGMAVTLIVSDPGNASLHGQELVPLDFPKCGPWKLSEKETTSGSVLANLSLGFLLICNLINELVQNIIV